MKSISASTHVPVATLEKEKAKSGLSYGDLYAAHAIAKRVRQEFRPDRRDSKQGSNLGQDRRGKQREPRRQERRRKPTAAAKPSPTPPVKTMRQIQAERYNGSGG